MLFKVKEKEKYINVQEYSVYAIKDNDIEEPQFLIYNEKNEWEWVWASHFEPLTQ